MTTTSLTSNAPVNDADVLDLAAVALPVGPVRFPTGNTYPVTPLNGPQFALYKRLVEGDQTLNADAVTVQLLRAAVPDATDSDWASLDENGRIAFAILGRATRRTQWALDRLKAVGNGGGGAATADATPPSAPSTTSPTSAAASPPATGRRSRTSSSARSGSR